MKLRVITVRVDPESGCFDDSEVVALSTTNEVLQVTDHFYEDDGVPTLALVVGYRERGPGRRSAPRAAPGKPVELDAADRDVYERLRKWRNERGKREGRPPYAYFTNDQLTEVARRRPKSREALAAIEGVGDARIRDFADEVLALIEGPGGPA